MISKERLQAIAAHCDALDTFTYPITAAELQELLGLYYRQHHLGSGPGRGTLEHRIEELEGTVAELSRERDSRDPPVQYSHAPIIGAYVVVCPKCNGSVGEVTHETKAITCSTCGCRVQFR